MNRRRFFGLTFAAVGAAVFAPWAAVKAWSATSVCDRDKLRAMVARTCDNVNWKMVPWQTMTTDKSFAKSDIRGISVFLDHSTDRMIAGTTKRPMYLSWSSGRKKDVAAGFPGVSDLIEHEAWFSEGSLPRMGVWMWLCRGR